MTPTLKEMPIQLENAGALRDAARVMTMAWSIRQPGRTITYSSDSTLRIGFHRADVLTREEEPILVSAWDNESDAVFDTL